jgi:hypothetical protein
VAEGNSFAAGSLGDRSRRQKPVQGLKEEEALATAAENTFGRLSTPEYVACFWSYLAAEDADDYRTGQSVLLDSGVAFS